jgi:archaeal type IV pilus assembly protein PilA
MCGVRINAPSGSIASPGGAGEQNAGVWDRFAAYLVDFIVGFILCIIAGLVIALTLSFLLGSGSIIGFVIGLVCAFLVYWLYYAYFESSSYQATPGKILTKIKVTDDNGQPLSFGRSLARSFLKILFTLSPIGLLALLNGIIIQISDTRKGIHDYIVNTRVVTTPGHDDSGGMIIIIIAGGIVIFIVITIILAAVIAAFVFGMAGNIEKTKVVAATVQQPDSSHIILTYQGGQDAGALRQITTTVTDKSGNTQTQYLGQNYQSAPVQVGSTLTFSGSYSGRDHVVATASFSDSSQQVILDTYV